MPLLDALHHLYQEYKDRGVDLSRYFNKPAIIQAIPQNIFDQKTLACKLTEKLGERVNSIADLLSSTTYGADLATPNSSYAAHKRVTIEEYYINARAVDDIAPGAKIGAYGVAITGLHNSFLNGLWNDYYFNDKSLEGQKIKSILKQDPKINYDLLDQYLKNNRSTFKNVVIHSEGYLRFDPYSRDFKFI